MEDGVIRVEHRLPPAHRHGARPLTNPVAGVVLPGSVLPPAESLLFLDTETSGLAGGTGTVAFMVGLARWSEEGLVVRQYLLPGFGGEAAMLDHLAAELDGVAAVVTYNGKSFDMPLLRDRFRLAGITAAMDVAHVDLLHPVRRLFRACWPDCRLATAEERLLGFRRSDDLPGAEAPLAWFDYLHGGELRRMPGVVRHNRDDLVSLAALLPAVAAAHERPAGAGADARAAAAAWLRAGDEAMALSVLQRSVGELDTRGRLELARLSRRAGRWRAAVTVWRELADAGIDEALEHLAKYYEHVCRDHEQALRYAHRLPGDQASGHRRDRIQRKLARSSGQGELELS